MRWKFLVGVVIALMGFGLQAGKITVKAPSGLGTELKRIVASGTTLEFISFLDTYPQLLKTDTVIDANDKTVLQTLQESDQKEMLAHFLWRDRDLAHFFERERYVFSKKSPLHAAVHEGNLEMAQVLTEALIWNIASKGYDDIDNWVAHVLLKSVLPVSASEHQNHIFDYLVAFTEGIDFEDHYKGHYKYLEEAVKSSNYHVVSYAIKQNKLSHYNYVDSIIKAAGNGDIRMVLLLIEGAGGDVDWQSSDAMSSNTSVMDMFLYHILKAGGVDSEKYHRYLEIIEILINNGAALNKRNKKYLDKLGVDIGQKFAINQQDAIRTIAYVRQGRLSRGGVASA